MSVKDRLHKHREKLTEQPVAEYPDLLCGRCMLD